MKADMERLEKDEETKVICLVSMLADREVMEEVLQQADRLTKPVVAVFLGADEALYRGHRVTGTFNLQEAAKACVRIAHGREGTVGWTEEEREALAEACTKRLSPGKKILPRPVYRRHLRRGNPDGFPGIRTGGPAAHEPGQHRYTARLKTHTQSEENTLLDMGDLDFTATAPHTVFDPAQRMQRFRRSWRTPGWG